MKFEISPIPPVCVISKWIRFLMRHTAHPQTGPMANDAIKAGSSETSSLIKLGIRGTAVSRNIRTKAIADNIAATVSFLTTDMLEVAAGELVVSIVLIGTSL